MATYKDSQRQERRLATKLGGTVNSGSGNGWIRKGDVRTEEELWELKITDKKSYSLKDAELTTNYNQSLMDGRMSAFLIEFKSTGNRWIIMSEHDYETLRERANFGDETP